VQLALLVPIQLVPVLLGHKGSRDFRVLLVRRVHRDRLVLLVLTALCLVPLVPQVRQEPPGRRVRSA
jgi:hypothetical protein